ncbi:MAG: trypsin-like serine protease [Mesorhizobium sp.]|nr:MAG: trypsin-like serine protease [Mesorhizobium sp.]
MFSAANSQPALAAQDDLVTVADILKISPQADKKFAQAVVDAKGELASAGIDTRLRMAHFLSQVMTETGGLRRLDENMNYGYKTLLRVFSRKTISEAKAREIEHKPVLIANWVYGDRLGNYGRGTQDGYDYRGSGYLQLTGRANFRARGGEIQIPLEKNPEFARDASKGLTAAIAYWTANNLNSAADNNDLRRVRLLINGPAAHGLDQSTIWFKQAWTRVFRAKGAAGFEGGEELAESNPIDEAALYDDILENGGLLSSGFESGADPVTARAAAIKDFQGELGLPETGNLDEATKTELLDPREWRYLDVDDTVAPKQGKDLDQSISFKIVTPGANAEEGIAPTEPEKGSGKTASNVNLTTEDARAFDHASQIYPDYELGGIGRDSSKFVPHSVIEPDTRKAVDRTTEFPARAIVQILFETQAHEQYVCSGTMISINTVLTAAHCIHSGTVAGVPFQNFRIIPGRNKGAAPFGRCGAKQVFVLSGWVTAQTTDESRYYDLGAIKLDCNVGEQTGWLGVRILGDSEVNLPTIVEGYATDKQPPARQWISEGNITFLWEQKGFYQNDTYGGTSGAPVLATGAEDTVIGVHTNGVFGNEEPWAHNNAFTRITAERLQRIQEWISQ